MNIRYLASARMPTEKAHGIQIVSMCRAFAAAGASVELLVPRRRNLMKDDLFEYYGVPRDFSFRRIRVLDLTALGWALGPLPYALLSRSFARQALRDARKRPADLYFIRDDETFIRFAEAGLPSVIEMHTVPRSLEKYRVAFENCVMIVTISEGIRRELVEGGVPSEKILVAPDGVDLKRFAPSIPKETARESCGIAKDARLAVYAGQLYPWKGADALVEAAALLPKDMEVAIVGGGAGREKELADRAKRLGSRARFVGQVPHTDIPRWLSAADCVVIPNSGKERISSHHTSPLKLFEAMAMGKAIVCSDLPSMREILDETSAAFAAPDDPASLAKAIESMLRDPLRAAKLGATARERASSFEWKSRAARILAEARRRDRTL